ncbi:hypothetical protein NVP1063O_134 [Vibrio phage 1.063.O._10N.261.45.C7]|nr:hypothetical protein NVP1063O_134 [Vibrio phage 1.063.O._10N.261.45.C7]
MTKQKQQSINKLEITYNNDTQYTIPRVTNFFVSDCGKKVSGCYDKVTQEHGIKLTHQITFDIDLKDVVEFSYLARSGETSSSYKVYNGRISVKTEYRTEAFYKKREVGTVVSKHLHNIKTHMVVDGRFI